MDILPKNAKLAKLFSPQKGKLQGYDGYLFEAKKAQLHNLKRFDPERPTVLTLEERILEDEFKPDTQKYK